MSTTEKTFGAHVNTGELVTREEIRELVHEVGRCLDDGDFEGLRRVYNHDATATTPGGRAEGIDALIAQARKSHTRTAVVQHHITDVVVSAVGTHADVRANLLATFADPEDAPTLCYQLGEVYRFTARRMAEGWRLTSVLSTPIWTSGRLPA